MGVMDDCRFTMQDALKGTFDEFMKALPHIETKVQVRAPRT